MSGWSRQIYSTWSNVSNIFLHSLTLRTGAPAFGSKNTVTISASVTVAASVTACIVEEIGSEIAVSCCAIEEVA